MIPISTIQYISKHIHGDAREVPVSASCSNRPLWQCSSASKTSIPVLDDLYQPNYKVTPCKPGTIKEGINKYHPPATQKTLIID